MRYLYLLFLLPTIAMAQDIAPLAADRPDQTETPYLVPKGMFPDGKRFFRWRRTATAVGPCLLRC
ncbi:hypothetical protein [Flavobacterium sp. N1718]|uniref:hypothetical protein n=1 Tax=Flavobacterium sp. N1718 TaxID=2986822 RepID=UPI0022254EEB|nr:hypothetical protein [Flavobacterium sp. N1718]